jgi:23S rRNA pseudoU1915 N3-methylase RlmH
MTEIEKIITSKPEDRVTRTELVPFIAVPERTTDKKASPATTFKDATKEDINAFVQNQKTLDEQGKTRLSERLLKIQQRLKEQHSSDNERGI